MSRKAPNNNKESLARAGTLRSGKEHSPPRSKPTEDSKKKTADPPPEGDKEDSNKSMSLDDSQNSDELERAIR